MMQSIHKKKKQKLSVAFSAFKISDKTESWITQSEESDLCLSSSETTSLEGETIDCSRLQTVSSYPSSQTAKVRVVQRYETGEETMEDETLYGSKFEKLVNIDKANKSFKRKRQSSEDVHSDSDIKKSSGSENKLLKPSTVTWADTSGLPLCRTIESKVMCMIFVV